MAQQRPDDHTYVIHITVGPMGDVLSFGRLIPRLIAVFKRAGLPTRVRIENAERSARTADHPSQFDPT